MSPTGAGADAAAGAPAEAAARELLTALVTASGRGQVTVDAYYARASDRMRSSLGGPERFAAALGNDRYAPLLSGTAAELKSLEVVDESARGVVTIDTAHGPVTFLFAVARAKHGERRGTWCLSGVAREGVDL